MWALILIHCCSYLCPLCSDMPHPMADKVICQSDSVTKYEITELQHQPSTTSSHAPSTTNSYAPSTTTAHVSSQFSEGRTCKIIKKLLPNIELRGHIEPIFKRDILYVLGSVQTDSQVFLNSNTPFNVLELLAVSLNVLENVILAIPTADDYIIFCTCEAVLINLL